MSVVCDSAVRRLINKILGLRGRGAVKTERNFARAARQIKTRKNCARGNIETSILSVSNAESRWDEKKNLKKILITE